MDYKLDTQRLTLRQLSMSDAQHIFDSWSSSEEVTQYLIYDCHQTIEDTKEWLGFVESDNNSTSETRGYDFGFELKSTGELIGSGGFSYSSKHECLEIGYNIMQSEWRKGYTLEACTKLIDFAKNELKVKKVVAKHAIDNTASESLLQKLGFKFTGESSYDSFSGKKHFSSKEYKLTF